MRKLSILLGILIVLPFAVLAQNNESIDFIAPFEDGVAAVKKGDKWGFINTEGKQVIPYRDDLVLLKNKDYPFFNNDRCIISTLKKGIMYFGYINKEGKTVIAPQFLNATNFKNNKAIVLKLEKERVGRNEVLGKDIVYYKYYEVIINAKGTIENYVNTNGVNIVLDKKVLNKPPKIMAKQLAENLIAIKSKKGKWTLKKLN